LIAVEDMSRKQKALVVRKGGEAWAKPPKKPRKPRAPKPRISNAESRELDTEIKILKKIHDKATTKAAKRAAKTLLDETVKPKKTKAQRAQEREERKARDARAREWAKKPLAMAGAPTQEVKLTKKQSTTVVDWAADAKNYLTRLGQEYPAAAVQTAINPDGSFDARLSVPIPFGESPDDVLFEIEEAAQAAGVPEQVFIAAGILFQLRDEELWKSHGYPKILGKSSIIGTAYKGEDQATAFVAARQIALYQDAAGYLKPGEVVIQIHRGVRNVAPAYWRGDMDE